MFNIIYFNYQYLFPKENMIQAKPYIDTMPSVYDKFALMAA
ncbi:MAG: hypothetical protein AB8U93_03285 [Francisella endosymbiont of Hyalomma scupense]